MAWNASDRQILSNLAAGTFALGNLRGGYYWVETNSTGAGTIDLQRLGPDGVTWSGVVTQITAVHGQQSIALAPGSYRTVIVGFTANYVEVTRIQMAVE